MSPDPGHRPTTKATLRPGPRTTSTRLAPIPQHSPSPSPPTADDITEEVRPPRGHLSHPLMALLDTAHDLLPATCITVTIGDPSKPARTLTRDTHGQALEGAQWRAGQGPTFTAATTHRPTTSADVAGDARWPGLRSALETITSPRWHPRDPSDLTAATGPLSVLAVPIGTDEDFVGVLSAYSDQPHAFADDEVLTRATLTSCAAALLIQTQERLVQAEGEAHQLRAALQTRACIEQAKGIVSAHLDVPVEDAFEVLSRASQNHNTKINRLAAMLVDRPADPGMLGMLHATAQRYGLYT